jgi:peptidyl-prolyl cis-trans isomerase B (cyclophilin B)
MGALVEGFAPPEASALRLPEARRLVSIYAPAERELFSPRVLISTRYGTIEIVLDLVDAPLTSMSFVRLAQAGFFNGLTFHRVVTGFLVQAGDPRGDGYGGSAVTIRCEYNTHPYGRGAVGMARTGKDTSSSQFFIALEPQPHLDGAYTQFGHVLSGMEVVDRLRPGDVIERIDVFDGREAR